MMGENRGLWERKSCGETENSSSASSLSEEQLDEEDEALNESPIEHNQSPEVTSKIAVIPEDINDMSFIKPQSPEVTSHATENVNDGSTDEDVNGAMISISKDRDVPDGLRNMSEKLSAALVNVSAKEDLVKQHAKVAEEAISGWEKAENEVTSLKKQLEALTLRNSTLEDRVTHLDSALRECVRQLRQTREEQEKNIHDAVLKKTHELESSKATLEKQLMEVQSKSDFSNASSSTSIDFDKYQKVEYLEKENTVLRHELQALSEKLELRTIEWNLSTQTAEMASKQHLESINKVARLEAECRRLTNMACRASTTSSLCCFESLKDGQSNTGERTTVEIDTTKKSGSEPDIDELSCSDSWASALIAELDQFKNEKYKQISSSSINIDLMDDFLEMERLAALPDTKNESFIKESAVANDCIHEESSTREEFDATNRQIDELKEKLEKAKEEKEEVKACLVKSECVIEISQLKMREAETKLEELQRELENAYKSKQVLENELATMQSEAKSITAKVHLIEAEVDKEKAISVEIENRYKELEEELERKKQEEKFGSITSFSEMKLKQEDLALAAGKLAECQKTIASLGNQLSSLATLEDFLIDTTSIPELSATPSLIARDGAVMLKSNSNGTYSTKRDSGSSSKNEESSPPPSSTNLPKHDSEKSINGFVNLFSQTEIGLQLEI
ncbi:Filament-like plant protein [Vigna unguiculata]|uniref:Filament-like plant protein n=1 Tax=Vigna unguiculata TaxID=3917 RepID=A0A4D6NSZ0_VIGUN|nr:Filament-like plant protein [Vigna unguiculata]